MTQVDLDEPTSFLGDVNLGFTQRECKPNENISDQVTKVLNHVQAHKHVALHVALHLPSRLHGKNVRITNVGWSN